jgi:hypothetical protein
MLSNFPKIKVVSWVLQSAKRFAFLKEKDLSIIGVITTVNWGGYYWASAY